jgi:hypothetical protein
MRTSGLFTLHHFNIQAKCSKKIKLIFFGDVHRDSPNHAEDEWKDFLKYAKAEKDAYFFGCGDYLDSTSTSEREMLGHLTDRMHETYRNDVQELQIAKVKAFAKEIGFMRGRLIGLLNGNHYFNFQDGTNTDQKLCGEMGCAYLGVSSFVRLYFKISTTIKKTFDIWSHHGCGAGRLLGGSINRVDQMREMAIADAYVMGDDHARMVVPSAPRFSLSHHPKCGLKMDKDQSWLLRSGSFLRGYTPGKSSYIVDSARGPRSIGHVELHITPRASCGKSPWFDVQGVC